MKVQSRETIEYFNVTEKVKTNVKGITNMSLYLKQYLDKTKDYLEKLTAMNSKFKYIMTQPSTVDSLFNLLRSVVQCQLNAFGPLINVIEKNISECEKITNESLECQKKLHKDYLDAETDFLLESKDIEKLKRLYHSDATTLESYLRTLTKKQRNTKKTFEDEDNQEMQKAMANMKQSEKNYIKRSSKGNMFMQNFTDRLSSATGGIQNLLELIYNQTKDIVFFTMLSLQNSCKEIVSEINIYNNEINKPLKLIIPDSDLNNYESLQELKYEPYKIKSLLKEYQEDFKDSELHQIIKTIAKNMIKKPAEYDIKLEDEKIKFNELITKMLTFTSRDFCTHKEIKYIEMLVQTQLFRSIFLQRLNNLRISGMFSWPQEHYVEVGKVIAMILDAVEQENDMETAKNVIILSQTYYFKSNENKVYLQKFIESHPLFESKAFWEEFMIESIQKELNNNRQLDLKLKQNQNETKEDYKNKLSNIVLSQLAPIADNMVGFNYPKGGIIKVLESVLEKYPPIHETQRNMIFGVIDKDLNKKVNMIEKDQKIKTNEDNGLIKESNEVLIEEKSLNKEIVVESISNTDKCINDNIQHNDSSQLHNDVNHETAVVLNKNEESTSINIIKEEMQLK